MTRFRMARSAVVLALGLVAVTSCGRRMGSASTNTLPTAQPVAAVEARESDVNDSRDPAVFAADARRRMDEITRDVRNDVAVGELPLRAGDAVEQHRVYIEGLLAAYSADGSIGEAERRHVRAQIEQLRDVAARYQREAPRARGGGPRSGWR